jgi:hypothetical protein
VQYPHRDFSLAGERPLLWLKQSPRFIQHRSHQLNGFRIIGMFFNCLHMAKRVGMKSWGAYPFSVQETKIIGTKIVH